MSRFITHRNLFCYIIMDNNGVLIPKFYLVSTNPDRVNTEDYLRKNLELETFYKAAP